MKLTILGKFDKFTPFFCEPPIRVDCPKILGKLNPQVVLPGAF
jgi:hypothetical protein